MSNETKQIDPAALAGITTGILMTDFSAVHEAAEQVMGHPVWTHQFPALAEQMRDAVLAQFPDMPTEAPDGWEACRDAVRARYGKAVAVRRGDAAPVSPFDHIPEHLRDNVIVAKAG